MCGRFSFSASKERVKEQLPYLEVDEQLEINFNIAPTQQTYVIANDDPRRLQMMVWGLLPSWSDNAKSIGKLINARCEGIESKPSFRLPIRQRRCLVLADSFYEWVTVGKRKVPMRILLKDDSLMLMAGVWDLWVDGKTQLRTFSIVTTEPNKEVSKIHTRMPLILTSTEDQLKWISPIDIEEVLKLMRPPEDGILESYFVSEMVNSVKAGGAELHLRKPGLLTLFD